MKRMSTSRALMLAGLHALLLAGLLSSSASAQRGDARNFTLAYIPGSATQNGYADAQLEMAYWFSACPEVHIVLQRPSTVHMVVGQHRYWYDGKLLSVPSHIQPPSVGTITVRGTARGNGIVKPISTPYAVSSPNCFTNGALVAQASQVFKKGMTDAEKVSVLNNFGFDPEQRTYGPLRSADVENYFREQFAQQARDSAQKVAAARSDSLRRERERVARARADSIARAQANRDATTGAATASASASSAAGASAGSSASSAAGASGSAAASATGSSPAGGMTQARRDSAARADRAREEEHARAVAAQRREQEIRDSIAIEESAKVIAQGAVAVAQLLGMVFDGLEGTGLVLGASYGSQYFTGDRGMWGITVSGYYEGFFLPFMDLNFAISPKDDGTERGRTGATIGSVIPKLGFSLPKDMPLVGGQWKPHAGLVWLTTQEQHREFNYIERNRAFLLAGLTHFVPSAKTVMRLETTIYGGTPKFGVALGKAF